MLWRQGSYFMSGGREKFLACVDVSRETYEKLQVYEGLLKKWQSKINLISRNSIENIWQRHFLDSAQIYPLLSRNAGNVLDVGTGAGFPGVVLSIMGARDVHLVEQNKKKCSFLGEVLRKTGTKATVHSCKIEEFPVATFDVVTARALTSLDGLLRMLSPYFGPETVGLFPKGRQVNEELTVANKNWNINYSLAQSISSTEGKIVVIKDGVSGREQ